VSASNIAEIKLRPSNIFIIKSINESGSLRLSLYNVLIIILFVVCV